MTKDVFVDGSFLVAVADPESDDHAAARALYVELIEQGRGGSRALVSHALTVGSAAERLVAAGVGDVAGSVFGDLIAPLEVDPVHPDAMRLARKTIAAQPGLDLVQAVTLALMARRRIRVIATLDPLFTTFDLEVIPRSPGAPAA